MNRGSGTHADGDMLAAAASMRPRFMNRGSGGELGVGSGTMVLQ